MVKPHERNTRYVDAVMTIPKARLLMKTDMIYSPVHLQNGTAERQVWRQERPCCNPWL
jgi:hypothetical protein